METVLHHTFNSELRIAAEEYPVLLTEAEHNPPAQRERAAQVMFETFSVPGLFLEKQSVLALLATRRTTGLVLQCGHGYTRAVPILDGKILRGVASVDVTGATVSHDLRERLRGTLKLTLETADDMKRATCYVRGDGEPPQLAPGSAQVEWIRSRPERFECPEALFRGNVALDEADTTASSEWQRVRLLWIGRSDPSCVFFGASKDVVRLIQKRCARVGLFRILRAAELKGIQGAIARSVAGWERDVCDKLCRNIVLAGDTTKLPGFAERLQKELAVAIPYAESIVVEQAPEYPAWFGGAHLASQESFQSSWISKNEYDETGPSIMTRRRRCY
jgi:actin-related protein